ncbi:MAG TPA: hypothetical protein ENI23_11245 [bacterium]|nr:hypothetical protein [bacterium]
MSTLKELGFAFGFMFLVGFLAMGIPGLLLMHVIPTEWFLAVNSLYATNVILYAGGFILSRLAFSFTYLVPLTIFIAILSRDQKVSKPKDKLARFLRKHPKITWIIMIVVAVIYSEMLIVMVQPTYPWQ